MKTVKTYQAKPGEVDRKWVVVDLDGVVLGRAATAIADILRGKNKPQYTPHVDCGDFVVVLNAGKVKLTGSGKPSQKMYYRHSGYAGGIKSRSAEEMLAEKPEDVIILAVRGMLPKNILASHQLKKLKVYRGTEHPHGAQNPHVLSLKKYQE